MIYKLQNGGIVKLQNASKPFESATAKSYFSGLKDYLLHQTKSFTPSLYKPTKGSNIQQQYYTRPGLKEEVVLNLFGGTDSNTKGPLGNYFYKDFDDAYNTLLLANESRTTSNGTLGKYGVSAGIDDRGRYISFIDTFDHVFIPGKGIPIYDRIYEDEIESLYNPNLSALNEGDWITRSPELKKRSKYKLNKGGVIKLQKAWTKVPRILRKAIKGFGETVDKTTFVPAQVKYYGPTMGKSYAAKTNPNLIDLDTWGKSEYDQLAKKYGYKDWREMILSDKGDYNEEYKQLIKDQIRRIQSDPQYSGKTIMVSNASLLKPDSGITFANTPVIPEQSIMATRNTARHPWESIEHGESWWNSLQAKGTPLRIDNRFVSDIEGSKELIHVPKITIPDVKTYHLVDSSMPIKKQGGILKAQKGTGLAGIPIIGSLARKAAYKIITNPDVAYAAGATPKLIVKSLFSKNQEDDNKKFFLYGVDRPYRDIGEAYNWQKDIDENGYKNVKSYEGVLNPYGEYLIDSKNKYLVEDNLGKDLLININSEYTDPNTGFISDSTPYFDDVHGYRLKFHKYENGNIIASASDLYDFGKNYSDGFSNIFEERSRNKNGKRILEMERNALNAVGQPYILTNKYPVRFVDNPEGQELMRVRNLEGEILNNKKSGGVLSAQKGTPGFVTPMTNQFTTKLMEILNKYLRKDQPEQKAVGTATWAYNKPSKIVKDGGDI